MSTLHSKRASQNTVVDGEKKMNLEHESLQKSRGLTELDKLKYEEKLRKRVRECEELEENITRLREDRRLSDDRVKRTEERYAKICAEHSKMNEKLVMLKNQIAERDQAVEVWEKMASQINRETAELKRQKLAADQMIEEMRRRQLESDQTVEELRRKDLEACETMEELRHQKMEADKAAEVYKMKFERLAFRITTLGEECANYLKVKVEDSIEEDEKVNLPCSIGGKKSMVNDGIQGVGDITSSNGSEFSNLVKKGSRNLPQSSLKRIEGVNDEGAESPPQAEPQYVYCPLQADSNGTDRDKETKRLQESGCSRKKTCSSAVAEDIIDIIDSDDDEPKPKKKRSTLGSDDDDLSIRGQKEKQIRKSTHNSNLPYVSNQVFRRCEEKTTRASIDYKSDDSTESCSEKCIDNLVASLLGRKLQRRWIFGTDLRKDFEEDDELCMDAVCVLYRFQISSSKSNTDSNGGLHHFDAMGGRGLAEYLIDGDGELKLRKTVSEVKRQRPDVVELYRRLASDHYEKLFMIYCKGEDPFFKP
ncbi:hypothetical protein BUALT_Bualt10G0062200 [Buddleja alternifolia]|uniref:Uncharacterized protein n=1 Tax=Buddleja alternifolia TaxID=168488 RepID=A0AAV6X326_9LAMI|nr:hypothetical protein BUALT_Bualt10G0062200 [Buddleja alternifolia]